MPKSRVLFLHITLPLYIRYIHILPTIPAMYDPPLNKDFTCPPGEEIIVTYS